jgi:hypothetical protein
MPNQLDAPRSFRNDTVNKVKDLSFLRGASLDETISNIQDRHFHVKPANVYISFGAYCPNTGILPVAFYCGYQAEQNHAYPLYPSNAESIETGVEAMLGTLQMDHPAFHSRKAKNAKPSYND